MSTPRNNPPPPSRRRNIEVSVAALVVALACVGSACATDPTSPAGHSAQRGAPDGKKGPAYATAPKTPKPSAKDDANEMTAAQLAAITPTWHTQGADAEAAGDQPLPLTCGFMGTFVVSQPVGPNGGKLVFGKSSLTIPKGALSATVQITSTLTFSQSGVRVDFAPHGQQFAKAVTILADYNGCTAPAGQTTMHTYYTDAAGAITQSMPNSTDSGKKQNTSITDHFSGYTIAWGRTAATQ